MSKFFSKIWYILTVPFRWLKKGLMTVILKSPFREFFVEEPEDVPLLDTLHKASEEPKEFFFSLLEHLDILRKHLLHSIIALVLTTSSALYFYKEILAWLAIPAGGIENLQAIGVTEPISVVMRVSLIVGFAAALPYISFELLRFVAPGISRKARWIGLLGIPLIFIFFMTGMLFTYYFVLSPAYNFLINFSTIPTVATPDSYLNFITGLMFWIGISFEFPLITFLLAAMGILPARVLVSQWRIILVVLTVFSAMITPTPDPFNMAIVMVPLWALYGFGILTALFAEKLMRKS